MNETEFKNSKNMKTNQTTWIEEAGNIPEGAEILASFGRPLDSYKSSLLKLARSMKNTFRPRLFAIEAKSGFHKKWIFTLAVTEDYARFLFEKEYGNYTKILSIRETDCFVE
jgi:hypothetical protein